MIRSFILFLFIFKIIVLSAAEPISEPGEYTEEKAYLKESTFSKEERMTILKDLFLEIKNPISEKFNNFSDFGISFNLSLYSDRGFFYDLINASKYYWYDNLILDKLTFKASMDNKEFNIDCQVSYRLNVPTQPLLDYDYSLDQCYELALLSDSTKAFLSNESSFYKFYLPIMSFDKEWSNNPKYCSDRSAKSINTKVREDYEKDSSKELIEKTDSWFHEISYMCVINDIDNPDEDIKAKAIETNTEIFYKYNWRNIYWKTKAPYTEF